MKEFKHLWWLLSCKGPQGVKGASAVSWFLTLRLVFNPKWAWFSLPNSHIYCQGQVKY